MSSILQKINQEMNLLGHPIGTRSGRDWLNKKLKELRVKPRSIIQDVDNLRENPAVGKMYFYFYDPKTKYELPFYDKFPLVIPIEKHGDGFLGLNLHYVPAQMRFAIIDTLSKKLNNKKMDETTRMRISYEYLTRLKNFGLFQPCIKKYLYSHVRSRLLFIDPSEWYFSCILPFEMFRSERKRSKTPAQPV